MIIEYELMHPTGTVPSLSWRFSHDTLGHENETNKIHVVFDSDPKQRRATLTVLIDR